MRSSDLRTVPMAAALQPAEDDPIAIAEQRAQIDAIIAEHSVKPGSTMVILNEIQSQIGHVSKPMQNYIAEKLRVPLKDVFGVVTFYSFFTMKPRGKHTVRFCEDAPCHVAGGRAVFDAIRTTLGLEPGQTSADGLWTFEMTSCLGMCGVSPVMLVDDVAYRNITAGRVAEILGFWENADAKGRLPVQKDTLVAQPRVILARAEIINPESLEDYLAHDGYAALRKAVTQMTPTAVIQEIIDAGVQGRGGAGFPIGLKLKWVAESQQEKKFVLCNADESEPGTFKDRLILESDPHSVLEGLLIAGYATGAQEGYIYVRGEYHLARKRLEQAIAQAQAMGFLGEEIFGTAFTFHVHLHSGAGAYICGEETALIESLEGRRGEPRIRPPYPVTYGVRGYPTAVNNVESLANLPPIIRRGAAWYRTMGTPKCPGTKIYTMLGDVQITGLLEAPMGTTLRTVIEGYGGGMKVGKKFKLAQIGGSSGSILDSSFLDVPMDIAELASRGGGLGSGALLICGDDTCVIDLARVLLRFFVAESCGKCVPCRIGTMRAKEILERLADARATMDDLAQLERIATNMQLASFCGLGQAAAVPILTGLRFFRDEFVAHADARTCPVGVCAMAGKLAN